MSKINQTLRGLALNKLNEELAKEQRELAMLKMGRFTAKEKDVHTIKKTRQKIARILTIIKEKELTNKQP